MNSTLPSFDAARPAYRQYSLNNFKGIPQIGVLSDELLFEIEVVGGVLPFKTNNYVLNQLIDWNDAPDDPIFQLTFPARRMLRPGDFALMANAVKRGESKKRIREIADRIRSTLNPHPAGQREYNQPSVNGETLVGMQRKYKETVLFFPSQGQTCHAYCSFCFRWPQFAGPSERKFAMRDVGKLTAYLGEHPEVTDVLFTGGDPLVMKTDLLAAYIKPLLRADLPNPQNIRIGTKALGYWPYRFLTDPDADSLLKLFSEVNRAGRNLALMAHFSHPRELETDPARRAIQRILETGAQIRTQSPLVRRVNDSPDIWADMWRTQARLGCVPYYMFVIRDTGAQPYFQIPLARAFEIYREAFRRVGGLSRTARGPVMSATMGKVEITGVPEINGEKVFALRYLQARNPDWVGRPFFAKYAPDAVWFDQLAPAFDGELFFSGMP